MVRAMSFRVDHNEPISVLVTRLREEHREIDRKLERISEICAKNDGNLKVAISLLNAVSTEILRHAVEEEARLARVIMESDKMRESSEESVKILQEHRRIKEFFDDELPYILDENSEKQARKKIIEFIDFVIEHHKEEEKELFPLSLRTATSKE
jgi:hemerythrin-like domain-containing protein